MLLWLVIVAIVSHKCVLVHWLLQLIPGDIRCVSQSVIISCVTVNIVAFSCSTLSLEPFVIMSEFNALEFVGNPSVEEFKNSKITKDDLKYIAKSLGITFNVDVRKDRLRSLILIHLGDTEEETPRASSPPSIDPQYVLEEERIKIQTLQMKLDFERLENERQRLENEKQRQHEIELKHLEIESKTKEPQPSKPDVLKYVKLIPSFPDADPEAFFTEFESAARHFDIPMEEWVWLIKPKLS